MPHRKEVYDQVVPLNILRFHIEPCMKGLAAAAT